MPSRFDCAVVGAGYTGLACAHRLAALRPDWRLAVIDAMRVGDGASGRNSGYVMDVGHWHDEWALETNRALLELSRRGLDRLRSLVQRFGVACDWWEGGRFHVCVNARGEKALQSFVDGMERLGERGTPVAPEAFAEMVGTRYYSRAFHFRGGALVNPAALVRGLAWALPDSVTLMECTPIVELEPGSPHRLAAEHDTFEADRIALATNGYMSAFGIQRSRVLPLATYASVTEPLPEPPGTLPQWGLVPEERMGSTVRLTVDRRILIRNGVRLTRQIDDAQLQKVRTLHRESFEARFPEHREVPFSHTWGGILGVTNNGGMVFGEFGERAWVAGAHNGVGMSLGTATGDQLAFLIAGQTPSMAEAIARLPEPSWMPPQPLLGIGVAAYTRILGALAGDER